LSAGFAALLTLALGKQNCAQVNEVKDVMVENIEKVLERGERIELLVDKTDVLRNQVNSVQNLVLPMHS